MKLLDYIRGLRKGKEAHRLEKESMQDPFLADAMDGYNQVEGNHEQRIEKLRMQVSAHSAKKKNTYAITWSIAACLIIGFGISSYFLFLKKSMPSLYKALGVYLPLITTNCAVLGVALTNVQKEYSIIEGVVNGIGTSVGFLIAIVIMAGIREKMEYNDISESFQGTPIVLITACLMAIAFCGFSGLI